MKIIFKIKDGRLEEARKAVDDGVSKLLPAHAQDRPVLRQMFPGVTSGRRSGLCVLDLPDDLPAERLNSVLRSLRTEEAIEYAELPAEKKPI